jgi:hypothetical protein
MVQLFNAGIIRKGLIAFSVLLLFCSGKSSIKSDVVNPVEWKQLSEGLDYTEINGPHVSKYSDSKVCVLKINPDLFEFNLVVATEYDSIQRTIKEWCEMKSLTAAINAGMYSLKDHISGTGYLQSFDHINNPVFKEGFNALAVFNPKDKNLPPFQIIDMVNQDWKTLQKDYNSCFQSIRMIDNLGQGIYWKKKPLLSCSMSVLAMDRSGNVLFLFSRSPYNANEYTKFMLGSPLNIQTAMYLEGGPEASLYIKTDTSEIIKFGSYVSYSCPNDDNLELRKMPNILGIKKKMKN